MGRGEAIQNIHTKCDKWETQQKYAKFFKNKKIKMFLCKCLWFREKQGEIFSFQFFENVNILFGNYQWWQLIAITEPCINEAKFKVSNKFM